MEQGVCSWGNGRQMLPHETPHTQNDEDIVLRHVQSDEGGIPWHRKQSRVPYSSCKVVSCRCVGYVRASAPSWKMKSKAIVVPTTTKSNT